MATLNIHIRHVTLNWARISLMKRVTEHVGQAHGRVKEAGRQQEGTLGVPIVRDLCLFIGYELQKLLDLI